MKKFRNNYKTDVLFWANLHPNKKGSFEDFIRAVNSSCKENNIKISFVFLDGITEQVKNLFNGLSYRIIPNSERNSMRTMIGILRETKPRLLHLNFLSYCHPIVLVGKMMGVKKLIFTDHSSASMSSNNTKLGRLLNPIKHFRRKCYIKYIDRFIAVSRYVANRLKTVNLIPSQKISIVYNGINLERFYPSPEKRVFFRSELFRGDQLKYVVSYVGQLIPEKGILFFLETAHKLLQKRTDVLFLIIGDGPLKAVAENSVQAWEVANIRFLGIRNDLEAILNATDIFVCPSLWEEAFGLVIAEAMACGVPVIASRVGGIPEVVKDKETGIIVSPNDHDLQARAIEGLLEDEELRSSLGMDGCRRATEYFSLKKMVSETVLLYQQMINDS